MTFYKFRPFEMKCSAGSSPESTHFMSQSSFMARAMQSACTHSSSLSSSLSSSTLSLELSILLSFVVVASLSILSFVSLSIIILS